MAIEWYYARNGRQHGPVLAQELKRLANDGTLQSVDLVWREGMDDWLPAGEVRGLLPYGNAQYAGEADYVEPYRNRRNSRGPVGQTVLIFSAAVMVLAMFLPWWSMVINVKIVNRNYDDGNRGLWAETFAQQLKLMSQSTLEQSIEDDQAAAKRDGVSDKDKRFYRDRSRFSRAVLKSRKWWEKNVRGGKRSFADHVREQAEETDDQGTTSITLRVWGWSQGLGITGLVFGAIILVSGPVFLSVPPIRPWNWILSIVAALMGLLVVIFAIVWIATSPGDDVGLHFRQGIIVGPYIQLTAGALFLIVGVIDGIFGIAAQMRSRRID